MPFAILILVALLVGLAVLARGLVLPGRHRRRRPASLPRTRARLEQTSSSRRRCATPGSRECCAAGSTLRRRPGWRSPSRSAVAVLGGILVGVLAYLMRSNSTLASLDRSVGQWGADHATHWSTQVLQLVTDLASTPFVIALIVVVGAVEMLRAPNRWIAPFLITVFWARWCSSTPSSTCSIACARRSTRSPRRSGRRFRAGTPPPPRLSTQPSRSSSRGGVRRARGRCSPAGLLHIAAGVACSRVMLGVHWLSDVIAGLAFGWAWFAHLRDRLRRPFPPASARPSRRPQTVAEALPSGKARASRAQMS